MRWWRLGETEAARRQRGFLATLADDVRGNTLAIMAAALVPMAALAGSGVDIARTYVVKVRLQQACDAGVLAGRKFMADSSATALDANATTQAKTFFANNFTSGWMKTNSFDSTTNPYPFVPTKTGDGQVSGTATITVPMTIMKMFNMPDQVITVTCEARNDVADTDVMFVLDTTGSMACPASQDVNSCNSYAANTANQVVSGNSRYVRETTNSRIAAVRTAVVDFFDTLNSPDKDPTTQLRFGFVPYSTTVNVGYIIPQSYLATSAPYQTRVLKTPNADANSGNPVVTITGTNVKSSECAAGTTTRTPAATNTYTSSGTAVVSTYSFTPNGNGSNNSSVGTCKRSDQTVVPTWVYQQATLDTSQFITGASVLLPTQVNGTTDTWEGCIEERGSTNTASFSQSSLPNDLNPDLTPTASDPTTQWKPMWFDAEFDRTTNGETTTAYREPSYRYVYNNWYTGNQLAYAYNAIACPKQAQRLAAMTHADVVNYVNAADFKPYGLTYHDIGMTWGLRFIAPDGPFGADTAAHVNHNPPNRFIVFLTDGDMEVQNFAYAAHGQEEWDKRVTTDGSTGLMDRHNARFLAECQAAKNRSITIFVVAYAQSITTQLQQCASPGQAYYASNDAALDAAFINIAKQVAMLRVSK